MILGVIFLPRQFLCRNVFGIAPPGAQTFFMLELDDGPAATANARNPCATIPNVANLL
jgi:hypothetical protein